MQRTPTRFILLSRKRVKNKIGLANFTFGENKLAKQKLTLANFTFGENKLAKQKLAVVQEA